MPVTLHPIPDNDRSEQRLMRRPSRGRFLRPELWLVAMSVFALTACNGSSDSDATTKTSDTTGAESSAAASATPTPEPTPEEEGTLPAGELEAFVKAFNSRDARSLCSRVADNDSWTLGEDGEADRTNLSLAQPGSESWRVCTDMYAAGWAACPTFKVASAEAGFEDRGSNAVDANWAVDQPYRALGVAFRMYDDAPALGWVWDGQNFECEG